MNRDDAYLIRARAQYAPELPMSYTEEIYIV